MSLSLYNICNVSLHLRINFYKNSVANIRTFYSLWQHFQEHIIVDAPNVVCRPENMKLFEKICY